MGCTYEAPTRGAASDAAACASVPCSFSFLFFGAIRADSGRIGPYRPQPPIPAPNRPIQAEIQKTKNKRCETHRLDKNPISQSTVLIFSSFSPSLVFVLHATALWPLLSVSPLLHNLTLKSLNSQLTHTLLSVSHQVLSILVFHSSHMLWLLLNVSVICFFLFFI